MISVITDLPVIVGVVEEEKKRLEKLIVMYTELYKDEKSWMIKKAQRNLKYCNVMLMASEELIE